MFYRIILGELRVFFNHTSGGNWIANLGSGRSDREITGKELKAKKGSKLGVFGHKEIPDPLLLKNIYVDIASRYVRFSKDFPDPIPRPGDGIPTLARGLDS